MSNEIREEQKEIRSNNQINEIELNQINQINEIELNGNDSNSIGMTYISEQNEEIQQRENIEMIENNQENQNNQETENFQINQQDLIDHLHQLIQMHQLHQLGLLFNGNHEDNQQNVLQNNEHNNHNNENDIENDVENHLENNHIQLYRRNPFYQMLFNQWFGDSDMIVQTENENKEFMIGIFFSLIVGIPSIIYLWSDVNLYVKFGMFVGIIGNLFYVIVTHKFFI